MDGTYSDIRLDTFDGDPGEYVLYNSKNPDKRYEVVSLLDGDGEEAEDVECAAGGVVKINENSFMAFTL